MDDQIEKNEMGGACGMYGGGERFIQGFGGKREGKETETCWVLIFNYASQTFLTCGVLNVNCDSS